MIFEATAFVVNALFSVLGAWAFAWAASVAFRRRPGVAKWLFVLPFAKLVLDAARGVAADSFVHSPYIGTRMDLGRFQIGGGVAPPFFPIFTGSLGARIGSRWYPVSAGELAAHGVVRHGGKPFLIAAIGASVVVALFRVLRRLTATLRFERRRRRTRAVATALPAELVDLRRVDVYVDRAFQGTPFTGGLLRPYVCFPADAHAAVSNAERRAALLHELAHVRSGDASLLAIVGFLTDVCWFVPGIGHLGAKVRALAERAADEAAVKHGADPVALASAIVCLAELGCGPARGVSFTVPGQSAAVRLHALLHRVPVTETRTRRALRWSVFAAGAYAALASRFLS